MTTLGIIIGNRGFFPAELCESGRKEILRVLESEGIKTIALPVEATKYGAIESLTDAQKCADLFKAHREEIDGVLVTLPNFGDERAVANGSPGAMGRDSPAGRALGIGICVWPSGIAALSVAGLGADKRRATVPVARSGNARRDLLYRDRSTDEIPHARSTDSTANSNIVAADGGGPHAGHGGLSSTGDAKLGRFAA